MPFARVATGVISGVPSNRIDIGAYEAQGPPVADFDFDMQITGNDFLIWQRGFGKANATSADGDSDYDTDVDASDLAVWEAGFGDTILIPPVSAVQGDAQSARMPTSTGAGAAIVNAAFAWELVNQPLKRPDTSSAERATIEAVFAGYDVVELPKAANVTAAAFSYDASDDDLNVDSAEPWLGEELRERVFGPITPRLAPRASSRK